LASRSENHEWWPDPDGPRTKGYPASVIS